MKRHKLGERIDGQVRFGLRRQCGTASRAAGPAIDPNGGQAELTARLDVMMLALRDVQDLLLPIALAASLSIAAVK